MGAAGIEQAIEGRGYDDRERVEARPLSVALALVA
jgi:hypothetical protein